MNYNYFKYGELANMLSDIGSRDRGFSTQGRINELTVSSSNLLEGYYAIIKDICMNGKIHPDYLEEKLILIMKGYSDLNNLCTLLKDNLEESDE